jgi:hypothetical protein
MVLLGLHHQQDYSQSQVPMGRESDSTSNEANGPSSCPGFVILEARRLEVPLEGAQMSMMLGVLDVATEVANKQRP